MKTLMGTARNHMVMYDDDGKGEPAIEIILMVTEPVYSVDAAGRVLKRNDVDSMRVVAQPEALRQVADSLREWADESDALAEAGSKQEELAQRRGDAEEEELRDES